MGVSSPASATPVVLDRTSAVERVRFDDPAVLAVLVCAAVLQLAAWSTLGGYQIADSVEFLERARTFVRGEEMIDSKAIRPFGFSALLVPFVALADWLGLNDPRPIVWCTYLLQIALGVVLVQRVMRIGAKIGGRACALASGFFVAANPVFLQYSAQAESGITAALCFALALEPLLDESSARGGPSARCAGKRAGIWLGLAFLVAYKSLLFALALGVVLVARDRWKGRATWMRIALGVFAAIGVQTLIDWAVYGTPGASVKNYLVMSFGGVTYHLLTRLGLRDLGVPLYRMMLEVQGVDPDAMQRNAPAGAIRSISSRWYYVEALPSMLVWPVLACAAIGVARAIFRARWITSLGLATLAISLATMFNKPSKDFRLWIPLLPLLAPLCGLGLAWLVEHVRGKRLRPLFVLLVVASTIVLGERTLLARNARRFECYWRAIDSVNARVRDDTRTRALSAGPAGPAGPAGRRERLCVGSAYHWAVYMREEPLVELVKLPLQVDGWKTYTPAQRARDLEELEELDVFLVHHPILSEHPELAAWIGEHFDVAECFFDRSSQSELGPLYVLTRRGGDARAARLFDVRENADRDAFLRGRPAFTPTTFARTLDDGREERVEFLGCDVRVLPPDDFAWITYHWFTPTGVTRELTIDDRLTAPDERNIWQNNHRAAWGARPSSEWRAGDLVSEGYPLVLAQEAFRPDAPWRPVGGGYRRGDRIPLRLWMELVELDPAARELGQRVVTARWEPIDPRTGALLRPGEIEFQRRRGLEFSADELVRVDAFFAPVHPLARVPDDGRAIPD